MSLQDAIKEAAGGAKHDENLLIDTKPKLFSLPIESIQRDATQPRTDVGDLGDIVESIKEFGVLQPIIVQRVADDKYQIIVGERRFAAAKQAELSSVPAIVRTIDEHRKLEIQVIENLHRKAFHPVEEAQAFKRLVDEHQHRHEDLARILGRSRVSISQTLRILSMAPDLLEDARNSDQITSSVLLEIAKQEDEATQRRLMQRAIRGELTVKSLRETKRVGGVKQPRMTVPFTTPSATVNVVFAFEEVNPAQVVEALSHALKEARLILKASNLQAHSPTEASASDETF